VKISGISFREGRGAHSQSVVSGEPEVEIDFGDSGDIPKKMRRSLSCQLWPPNRAASTYCWQIPRSVDPGIQ